MKHSQAQSALKNTINDIKRPTIYGSNSRGKLFAKIKKNISRLFLGKSKYSRIVIVTVVFVISFFAYNYVQTRNELKRLADPKTATQAEAEELATTIGKYLELPEGETPSIATVKNATQLTDQSFFAKTKNGDKVLIYPEAGKAILYRPDTKKVLEYSSVKLQDPDSVNQ